MRSSKAGFLALSLTAFAVACGARGVDVESTSPPAHDPVGMYDFTATLGSETRTGTIEVRATDDGYGGIARVEGEDEPAIITALRVDGSRMFIEMSTNSEDMSVEMNFTGDAFTGDIFAGSNAIPITGARRAD